MTTIAAVRLDDLSQMLERQSSILETMGQSWLSFLLAERARDLRGDAASAGAVALSAPAE